MNDALRIFGDPCGPGTFRVESATNPGHWWDVEAINRTMVWCPCLSFQRKNACRHAQAAVDALDAEAAARAANLTPDERAARARRVQDFQELMSR